MHTNCSSSGQSRATDQDTLANTNTPAYAFTNAETFFQFAWVVGALLPVVIDVPEGLGLTLAGLVALAIQVIYISAVLVPVVRYRRSIMRETAERDREPPDKNVLDLM